MHQLLDPVFQRVGCLMDALDAFQPALELDLVLANLRFHRCHDRFEPGFGIPVGALEGAAHLNGDFFEEFLRQLVFFVRQQLQHVVKVCIAPLFKTVDFLFVADQGKVGRRAELETVFNRKSLVDCFHHAENFVDLGV